MNKNVVVTRYALYALKNLEEQTIDYQPTIKRVEDIIISLLVFIVLLPVFLLISISIKLSSRGPVFYKQDRIGLIGRKFSMYKFRTMVPEADKITKGLRNDVNGPVFKMKNDPRITKIGKFLRQTGLDELPQLFNVINGEMSLVGPRPGLYNEVLRYRNDHLKRLSVKPGITCLWQIRRDRYELKFSDWMKLDAFYIDNWSLDLDLRILSKTVGTIFQKTGI